MVKAQDIIEMILKTIFVIFAVILIIQLILKITGHSPNELQLLYIGFGGTLAWLFAIGYKLGALSGEFNEFKDTTKRNFVKVEENIQKLEHKLEEKVQRLEDTLGQMQHKLEKNLQILEHKIDKL